MSGLRHCTPPAGRQILVARTPLPCWPGPPHWRAEVVLLTSPRRCMVSGRRCYPLALRLTNALDDGRSVILDLTVVAALVDSGMTILEAGLGVLDEPDPDD